MKEGKSFEINSEERLQPRSQEERDLWGIIEKADKPIIDTLKRINRILKDSFPDTDVKTLGSCSGHVKKNGSIAYKAMLPELINKVHKIEITPSMLLCSSADRTSSVQKRKIKETLEGLFLKAIKTTNQSMGKECVALETPQPYVDYTYEGPTSTGKKYMHFPFFFPLLEKKMTFSVLQNFWRNIERGLSEIDGLQIESSYNIEDFYVPPIKDP